MHPLVRLTLGAFAVGFFLLALPSIALSGAKCSVFEWVGNSNLASNDKFWGEFAELQAAGKTGEGDLLRLAAKHSGRNESDIARELGQAMTPGSGASAAGAVANAAPTYRMARAAEKSMPTLPKQVHQSMDDFLTLVRERGAAAIPILRQQQGRWQVKKLKGSDVHSARLNGGYRVNFTLEGDTINILEVGRDVFGH